MISWAAWESIGGLKGAIAQRADEVLAGCRDDEARQLVRDLFSRLVQLGQGTEDTRCYAARSELRTLAPERAEAEGGAVDRGSAAHRGRTAGVGGARSRDPAVGDSAALDRRGPRSAAGAARSRAGEPALGGGGAERGRALARGRGWVERGSCGGGQAPARRRRRHFWRRRWRRSGPRWRRARRGGGRR